MKHFYLIANPSKPGALGMAEKLEAEFLRRGAACMHTRGYTRPDQIPTDTECIITLGGDGTLIQASRDLISLELPMMGINMGHLGYLTQVSGEEFMDPVLDALLNDSFTLEKRMMLEGSVVGAQKTVKGIALNEIGPDQAGCASDAAFPGLLKRYIFNEYMADGIIAATPTGSTAYNLSAGGPIVAPGAQLMLLTPICSHSISARSIVLSPEDRISIRLVKWSGGKSYSAVFDGDQVFPLHYGEKLEICRAPKYTTLIQLKNVSFLENIRQKMNRI